MLTIVHREMRGFFQDQVEDSGLEHKPREIGSAFQRVGTEIGQKGPFMDGH